MMDHNYIFCPEPHCCQILKLFTNHLCHHPFFPTSSGSYQTKEEIQCSAVYQMYVFCHECGLTEAWAYLWNSWYSCWNLWACSSSGTRLSRCRQDIIPIFSPPLRRRFRPQKPGFHHKNPSSITHSIFTPRRRLPFPSEIPPSDSPRFHDSNDPAYVRIRPP